MSAQIIILAQLVNGITLGGMYALIALGYTLVYGILLMINFAHSELFMSGAFVGLGVMTLLTSSGVSQRSQGCRCAGAGAGTSSPAVDFGVVVHAR